MSPRSKQLMTEWIKNNTKGSISVVDFGCMLGSRFKMVASSVVNRIGIEIWKPYLDAPQTKFTPIHGDMRDFESLVDPKFYDCALFIDTIEHIPKDDGLILLKRVQELFNRIVLITPNGYFKWEVDVTGFDSHESQKHKSSWYEKDLGELGFETKVIKDYNPPIEGNTKDCLFGVWNKC